MWWRPQQGADAQVWLAWCLTAHGSVADAVLPDGTAAGYFGIPLSHAFRRDQHAARPDGGPHPEPAPRHPRAAVAGQPSILLLNSIYRCIMRVVIPPWQDPALGHGSYPMKGTA